MWFSTPSAESLTRPRVAIAVVSALAAISAGYYAYHSNSPHFVLELPDGSLHRSNAVRRNRRRSRRSGTVSSSSSDVAGDENAENTSLPQPPPQPSTEGETGVEENNEDEWWNDPNQLPPQRAGHNIVSLLFRVSEDNARRNGCVHRGCQCNACGMVPIRGIRYRCANCADFDLCETCESQGVHIKTHIFYKIRIPVPPFGHRQMQPVWYTGDPESCRRAVPRGIMARLSKETGFERPELEAFWEQWTFMANTEWRDDPDQFCIAMDRKTFERCLVPTGASAYAEPNLIHDRMFAFYDSNNDDLIGFSEFLHGLSYRRRKDKLQTVFDGYDIDGDGYVNRRDFLRMFKAYYVLYKQMHRDILDGLENQLLASTEAQQLVNGRQPLSSLFGREERVPQADSNMRFEGKTYHPDGHVAVDKDKEAAFVENENDTATRRDILTSLFACETDRRARRRGLVIGHDGDGNWRTARRASGADADGTYWLTMLDPPNNLEQLSDVLLGNNNGADEDSAQRDSPDEDEGTAGDEQGPNSNSAEARPPTESEARARAIERSRRQAPKLDKKRRDMARRKIHDRWRRRQFYLDQEEGGAAPDDWSDGEDILAKAEQAERREKRRRERRQNGAPASVESDTSSDDIPFQIRRDDPAYRHGFAENDAGKEILYQVTQQAFNELLDVIFKPAEDLAVQAAETRLERAAYADLIDEFDPSEADTEEEGADGKEKTSGDEPTSDKPASEKCLEELLKDSGYSVEPSEPRNAVDLQTAASVEEVLEAADSAENPVAATEAPAAEYRDPTLPQFRPNSVAEAATAAPSATVSEAPETKRSSTPEPSNATLREWKRLNLAEIQAEARGGWGKLNFAEFEEIYKSQETQGNRLDYLGSWIDFCIP